MSAKVGTKTALESYIPIRDNAKKTYKEISEVTTKVDGYLKEIEAPFTTLAEAKVPSLALVENLTHENPNEAAKLQDRMADLPGLQEKANTLRETSIKLQKALQEWTKNFEEVWNTPRPVFDDTPVAEVETNDAVFAAAKIAFEASQKNLPAQLKAAQDAAQAAAEFVAQVNSEEGEVDAKTAETNLTKWEKTAEVLAQYILGLNETHAKLGADRIPLASETPEDSMLLATLLGEKFAKEHEKNFEKAKEYRTQLDKWKDTLGNQLGELHQAHAALQNSLSEVKAIQAYEWKRVPGYIESAGGLFGAIGGIVAAPAAALVNVLSSSQLDQYKDQAQRLSNQMGDMSRKITNAEEGSLVHEELDKELATYSAALAVLESDLERLEETDKEGLPEGLQELKKMHQELLATQKSGWKKPVESTLYTRIFGKKG